MHGKLRLFQSTELMFGEMDEWWAQGWDLSRSAGLQQTEKSKWIWRARSATGVEETMHSRYFLMLTSGFDILVSCLEPVISHQCTLSMPTVFNQRLAIILQASIKHSVFNHSAGLRGFMWRLLQMDIYLSAFGQPPLDLLHVDTPGSQKCPANRQSNPQLLQSAWLDM